MRLIGQDSTELATRRLAMQGSCIRTGFFTALFRTKPPKIPAQRHNLCVDFVDSLNG